MIQELAKVVCKSASFFAVLVLFLCVFLGAQPVEMRTQGVPDRPATPSGVLSPAEAADLNLGTDCLLPADWKYAFDVDHAVIREFAGGPLREMDFDKAFEQAQAKKIWLLAVCK